jgi:hypothetical protein
MKNNIRLHEKEIRVQIYLPIGLAFLVVGTLVLLMLFDQGVNVVAHWSHISIILLIIPVLFLGLLSLLLFVGVIILLGRLYKILPANSKTALSYFYLAGLIASNLSKRITSPIVRVRSISSSIQKILSYFRI